MSIPIDSMKLLQLLALTLVFGVGMAHFANSKRAVDRLIFGAFSGVLLLRYAIWRSTETLPDPSHGFASVWSYLFYAFEMIAVVYTLATMVVMVRRRDSRPFADAGEARLRAAGNNVPAVDVFIATYNEDLQILEKTHRLSEGHRLSARQCLGAGRYATRLATRLLRQDGRELRASPGQSPRQGRQHE
jgi:cellulose synthase (UDP-forming)